MNISVAFLILKKGLLIKRPTWMFWLGIDNYTKKFECWSYSGSFEDPEKEIHLTPEDILATDWECKE